MVGGVGNQSQPIFFWKGPTQSWLIPVGRVGFPLLLTIFEEGGASASPERSRISLDDNMPNSIEGAFLLTE